MALVILGCAIIGVCWGWYAASGAQSQAGNRSSAKVQHQETAFVLPMAPPEVVEFDGSTVDPRYLRIWEVGARQPLPPRKEPLTPPAWKIVGVTSVGKEQSILLLFANQSTTEARKNGDTLPGGAKIVQISQDYVRIALNGQLMKLSLRKQ